MEFMDHSSHDIEALGGGVRRCRRCHLAAGEGQALDKECKGEMSREERDRIAEMERVVRTMREESENAKRSYAVSMQLSHRAKELGVPMDTIAEALGVERSTLYSRWKYEKQGKSRIPAQLTQDVRRSNESR